VHAGLGGLVLKNKSFINQWEVVLPFSLMVSRHATIALVNWAEMFAYRLPIAIAWVASVCFLLRANRKTRAVSL
jgi:hypothetical protein